MGMFFSAPGQSYSVAVFIEPMLDSMGLLRTQFSTAYLVATTLGALCLPRLGRLLDRRGARVVLPLVALAFGASCLWMAQVSSLIGLYFGFTLIRCFGQGALTLSSTWLVGQWFRRRRGMAMGLVGLGGTMSVMLFPVTNHWMVEEIGWRWTWVVLAFGVWGFLILPSILLVRNRPEDIGLLPDGATAPEEPACEAESNGESGTDDEKPHHPLMTDENWTLDEAYRTFAFWKLLSALATSALVGTGLIFHQVSLMKELLHVESAGFALSMISVQAIVATLTAIVGGMLADRFAPRRLIAVSMAAMALSMVVLMLGTSYWIAPIYSALLGLHGGIMRSAGTVVWINFFGRLHYGAIQGFALTGAVLASAVGPLPLAWSADYLKSFTPALWGLLVLPVAACILVWSAHPPVRGRKTPEEQPESTPRNRLRMLISR